MSKTVSEGSSSSRSVNNDWVNWVVLCGDEKVAVEDVRGIRAAIGVQFIGDNNMFGVLAKKGRWKRVVRREGKEGGKGLG